MPEPSSTTSDSDPLARLPKRLLYTSSARLGGSGLDVSTLEGAKTAFYGGYLAKVVAFANQQDVIPAKLIRSLRAHPVRLLSGLGSEAYYGAKKFYVDWIGEREMRRGCYDFFHGWSGDALRTLVAARQLGVPSVMDIPTWHRNKGLEKKFYTKSEKELERKTGWQGWKERLQVDRQRQILEYELADVLLMPSTCAMESFLAAGIPQEKLHFTGRGVNVEKFQPAAPPAKFRLIFVGALIERKGVHHLIRTWRQLRLKDAELVLVGSLHDEIKPVLAEAADSSIILKGFVKNVAAELAGSSAFVFPSELEGAAKATFEAAACGLAQITTRESGDAVVHGETGLIIPPNDPDALAAAIGHFYNNPAEIAEMGRRGRERIANEFTWDHFRSRVAAGYAKALARRASGNYRSALV